MREAVLHRGRLERIGERLRAVLRPAGRVLLKGRFLLFQRHRHGRLVLETVAGRSFLVLPHVFNPKLFRSGAFLAETLDERLIPRGSRVLDMGTGSGVGAVCAARWAAQVDAVDINPAAVRCARINALLHEAEHTITIREGDLFAPLPDARYDVILFNPPYFRGHPRTMLNRAWRSVDVVERFAEALGTHLQPEGYALVVLSTDGAPDYFLACFEVQGYKVHAEAEQHHVNETFTIYRVMGRQTSSVERQGAGRPVSTRPPHV